MHVCMEARRHDRGPESLMHDFALVATYLPILSLTLRATLLVSFMFWCMDSAQLHFAGILALSASIVYLDSLVFRTQMDTAAGHLCLCGLAVLSQKHSQQCSDTGRLMLLLLDILWSTMASAEVIGSVRGTHTPLPVLGKAAFGCCCMSAHVILACSSMGLAEQIVRAVVFYLLCSLVMLCIPFAPAADRCCWFVLHLCAPVLFVHAYPTVASVLVVVGSNARLVYMSMHRRKEEHTSDIRECVEERTAKPSDYSSLTAQLQAAKRAHGLL